MVLREEATDTPEDHASSARERTIQKHCMLAAAGAWEAPKECTRHLSPPPARCSQSSNALLALSSSVTSMTEDPEQPAPSNSAIPAAAQA